MMNQTVTLTEQALLGFLYQTPLHGYAIHQRLSDPAELGGVWQLKLSQLYAQLTKLEAAGFVSAEIEPQHNKPPRKVYQLTDAGRRAFLTWIAQPVAHGRALRLEFLVKLYFARQLDADVATRLLSAQRITCEAWLAEEQAHVDAEGDLGRGYSQLVHQFRLGQIQAMLTWLDQCDERIAHER